MQEFLLNLLRSFWTTLSQMSPYLLFGFLVAGFLSILVPPALVERHLGGKGLWPIVKSSIFGVPLPLCSCGVIPVAASLRRHGASRGATTAFLLSTPQTGVDSILVTYSLLGAVIAIFRPIAAFVSGLVGGAAVAYLAGDEENGGTENSQCHGECCVPSGREGKLVRSLKYGFVTLPQDIGRAVIIGLVIAAFISAIIPKDFLAGRLGTGFVGMLVMMAVGIPMYVCATASVPIAAALMAKGASAGAAMVFLMTGPATNAATIATVWKIMGRRTAIIYLATVALTSLAAGFLLDHVFARGAVPRHAHDMENMGVGWFNAAAAVALILVLGLALWRSHKGQPGLVEDEAEMKTVLEVGGMHCSHCAAAVERALRECAGVESVKVDLAGGKAVVTGENLDETGLAAKVTQLGYTVRDSSAKDAPGQPKKA